MRCVIVPLREAWTWLMVYLPIAILTSPFVLVFLLWFYLRFFWRLGKVEGYRLLALAVWLMVLAEIGGLLLLAHKYFF